LTAAGLTVALFDGVGENPTSREVEAGAAFAAGRGVDLIAAVGGGSAMDGAKGINFLLTNGGRIEDYHGFGRAGRPLLASIGVPTTAGTGSEAQSYALISDPASHRKMACGDERARFRTVILDPELTGSAPPAVAAAAGLDAVAHAVESYVSTRANPVSRMLAREAWRLLAAHLETALGAAGGERQGGAPDAPSGGRERHVGRPSPSPTGAPGTEIGRPADEGAVRAARGATLLAAHLAGAAIEQSMLGAAHASANPLTARYGVPHGVAVGLMLPWVVRFNAPAAGDLYAELAAAAGLGGNRGGDRRGERDGAAESGTAAAERLAERIAELRAAGGLPARLRARGVDAEALTDLAHDAAEQWTGRFNPRPVGKADLRRLYEAAF
jgi:alcohol dehydrogenase